MNWMLSRNTSRAISTMSVSEPPAAWPPKIAGRASFWRSSMLVTPVSLRMTRQNASSS
jgi:hypothetical protein